VEHDLKVATAAGALGSIDANAGDELLGWDTDQFPTNIYDATRIMLVLLDMGGFSTGGLNFDAKRRRESHEPIDLFHAHIGGMDTFARGLKAAAAIRADGRMKQFVSERYGGWNVGVGSKIERGEANLTELEAHALSNEPKPPSSGRQEMLENLFNEFI
jgi:xylose isomerase